NAPHVPHLVGVTSSGGMENGWAELPARACRRFRLLRLMAGRNLPVGSGLGMWCSGGATSTRRSWCSGRSRRQGRLAGRVGGVSPLVLLAEALVASANVVPALARIAGALGVQPVAAPVALVGLALVALQVLALVGVGPHHSPPGWSTTSPSRISPVSRSTGGCGACSSVCSAAPSARATSRLYS